MTVLKAVFFTNEDASKLVVTIKPILEGNIKGPLVA